MPVASFLDSLGDRGRRRAEPRTSISLAGAAARWGSSACSSWPATPASTTTPATSAGSRASCCRRSSSPSATSCCRPSGEGPLATAGTVAAALGVPAFMFFVTFDENGLPPYNTEAILIVSTAVWLGTYVVGPGQGPPVLPRLGAHRALVHGARAHRERVRLPVRAFGVLLRQRLQSSSRPPVTSSTRRRARSSTSAATSVHGGFEEPSFDPPDPATIGMLSLRARRRVPARRAAGSTAAGATAPPRRSRSRRSRAWRSA